MYSGSNQPSPLNYGDRRETTPLTPATIAQALDRSPDHGLTLVLSKLNLSDVGAEAALELAKIGRKAPDDECTVERITLGSNRLTTLPTEFALLSRLRYLNLKHNNLSSFPDVLTLMPSLDTLDISHNKIKRFPAHPGRLVDLRVFSFSKNKITRLPPYFAQFRHLELLKLDRNPLEWPPRNILQSDVPHEGEEIMKDWIETIQEYIDYYGSPHKLNDDSGYSEMPELDPSTKQDKQKGWKFPFHEIDTQSATSSHNRTFSVDSQASAISLPDDSNAESDPVRPRGPAHFKRALRDLHHTGQRDRSPARPSDPFLGSPADSEKFDFLSPSSQSGVSDIDYASPAHLRAVSVATDHTRRPANAAAVAGKQSLPDLRSPQWRKLTESPEQTFTDFIASQPETGQRKGVIRHQQYPIINGDVKEEPPRVATAIQPAPSMAFERNSYFQRLSTMPTSVKLPTPLSSLVETARSILFVTSQIYQTIEHYANHAIDQKYSAAFKRVLEPANADMLELIRALDKFDATSQKGMPQPPVCRAIVDACRKTVVVTGRAVGVFAIQLRLAPCDDHRYSRWILLELYASTAEISVAWQNLLPHLDALRSFLHGRPVLHHHQPSATHLQAPPFSQSPPSNPQYPPLRLRNTDMAAFRSHNARRHAGSFSYRDVELGKVLPSIDEPPNMPGFASQTPTMRNPKRMATIPATPPPPLAGSVSGPGAFPPTFSLNRSEGSSLAYHSREPSFDQPFRSAPTNGSKLKSLDLPTAVRHKPDREAILSIRQTLESSPKIWDTVEDAITPSDAASRDIVRKARELSRKLSIGLRNALESDRLSDPQLTENAQLLSKFVTQISSLVRNGTLSRAAFPTLQGNISRIAEAAEDLTKIGTTTSAPSTSVRPYSPQFNNPFPISPGFDDNRLGQSLSRTRSAQPSPSLKALSSSFQEGPRSALPSSTGFKIPSIHRTGSSQDGYHGFEDPG